MHTYALLQLIWRCSQLSVFLPTVTFQPMSMRSYELANISMLKKVLRTRLSCSHQCPIPACALLDRQERSGDYSYKQFHSTWTRIVATTRIGWNFQLMQVEGDQPWDPDGLIKTKLGTSHNPQKQRLVDKSNITRFKKMHTIDKIYAFEIVRIYPA